MARAVCNSTQPMPTFNWVLEYHQKAYEIYTQPSRYKIEDSNLLADEIGPQHWARYLSWLYIYLYLKKGVGVVSCLLFIS